MKKSLYIFLLLCLPVNGLLAETKADRLLWKNEIRIGWGDQLFESLVWHNPTSIISTMPASNLYTYHEDYRYHQHLWLEYQRRCTHWFSVGVMADVSQVGWNDVTRNGKGQEIARSDGHYFYNVVIMPTMRFTYFHHPNVNFYTSIGLGLDINGGTEKNVYGKTTECGAAVNVSVFGVSANYKNWFATVDVGGMTALRSSKYIYLAASRMINVSIGARF